MTVSSNEMYSEVQKLQAKTVPHRTTETGEIYAMSTKGVSEEAHSELYTYARVDQKVRCAVLTYVVTKPV